MKIDFTEPIRKNIKGEDFDDVEENPIIPADQFATLAYLDKGEIAKTAKEAYQLNALMEKIACSKGPIEINGTEKELLEKTLDQGLENGSLSSFLAGRLYELLNPDTN